MDSVKKVLDIVLYWITVVLFAALVAILVWQIFTRQVIGNPATWTEEGARMTFVWLGLFASAFVFGERGHIAVEFVARKLPQRGERILQIIVQTVVLAFAVVVLIWGGWRAAGNAWLQNLSAMPFTLGQMYLALPIAGSLIAFYALYYIQGLARGTVTSYGDHTDEDSPLAASPEVQADRMEIDSMLIDSAGTPDSASSPDSPRDSGTGTTKEA